MNKVFLSGNLTRDPEVRYTQGGMPYAKMGIAVNRPYSKNNTEGQPTVDFFNLTSFGKTAEFCGRYFKKGTSVIVEGRIQNDNYEDKNGVKRYNTNIMVDNIEFAGNKRSGGGENSGNGGSYGNSGRGYEGNSKSQYDDINGDEVDVPF